MATHTRQRAVASVEGHRRSTPSHGRRTSAAAVSVDPAVVRRAVRVLFAALLIVTGLVVTASLSIQPEPPRPGAWSAVTVSEGASLWDIAAANPVPGLGIRDTIALIRETNGLDSPVLVAGQVLSVPSSGNGHAAVAQR